MVGLVGWDGVDLLLRLLELFPRHHKRWGLGPGHNENATTLGSVGGLRANALMSIDTSRRKFSSTD